MHCQFHELWLHFEGSFREFFEITMRRNCHDCFVETHFWHSGNRAYIFEEDIECLNARLRAFESGMCNNLDT